MHKILVKRHFQKDAHLYQENYDLIYHITYVGYTSHSLNSWLWFI